MCPYSRRRPSLRIMECERASRVSCLLSGLQGTEAKVPQTADGQERRYLPSGNAWKNEFLQALQALHSQFRLFGTFTLNNVNAGGSATLNHKNLLPDGAIVTHEITCQGRDHIVRIQSGESVLVVINVHFEPDLILRNLREWLRRIAFHWPRYPEGFGMVNGDLNIYERQEPNRHRR